LIRVNLLVRAPFVIFPLGAAGSAPQFLIEPTEALQVKAVLLVEFDAFLLEQAPLERVAAIAGQAVGHLSLGVDDTMPGNFDCRVEMLKHLTNQAGAPRQASHRRDLPVGRNPALGNAADDSVNRRDGFIALGWSRLEQLALRWHRRLSSIVVVVRLATA